MSTTTHGVSHDAIRDGILFLRARCDGAVSDDGVGFRAQDVKFGFRLASLPDEAWDADTYEEALRTLGVYVDTQLPDRFDPETCERIRQGASQARKLLHARRRAAQLAWDQERQAEADAHTVTITETETGLYAVSLHVSQREARQALKDATQARWDAPRTQWLVRPEFADALLAWADEHADTWPESLVQVADRAEQARADKQALRVTLEGDRVRWTWDPYARADGWTIKDAVKALPGSTFDGASKTWTTDLHPRVAEVAERFDNVDLDTAVLDSIRNLDATIQKEDEERAQAVALSRAQEAQGLVDVAIREHLYPFQEAGVEYAALKKRVLIADEMGLGKTRQAISTLLTTKSLPAVVVCPASLKGNWKREVEALSDLKVYVASGTKLEELPQEADEADVVVVNYDVLKAWEPFLVAPRALVLDESHYAKNPQAQRSKAALALAQRVPDEGVVVLLTGTPILNRPVELVQQLRILGTLKDVAPTPRRGRSERDYEFSFKFRYCGPESNGYGWTFQGASNLEELNQALRASCYVRRRKVDVLTELPLKLPPVKTWLTLNGALKEYRKAEEDIIRFAWEHGGPEAAYAAERAEVLVRLNTLRRLAGEAKVEAAKEWVLNWLDSNPDQSLVVFANHKVVQQSIIGALRDAGIETAHILGSQADVEEHKARFQAGEARVIVCSLKAAREGHTLTAASNVVFLEQGWTPGEHQQAEDRCHRIGQEQDVQPWYLLAEDTVDEDLRELIEFKAAVVAAGTDGGTVEQDEESIAGQVFARLVNRNT